MIIVLISLCQKLYVYIYIYNFFEIFSKGYTKIKKPYFSFKPSFSFNFNNKIRENMRSIKKIEYLDINI